MSAQTINVYCVAIEALAFNIVGVFGNVQLLWITARRKFTHTKPGLIFIHPNLTDSMALESTFPCPCSGPLSKLFGKSNAVRGQQKVVRRLQVIVIVFILSWFMALLGVNIASLLKFPPDVRSVWQSNMVFFALVCYSQTFYVCVWRSSDYREAFMNQLRVMACRAPKTMFDSSASRSQVAHVAATQHL
ncbi:hypothetical protein RB195_001032 [Necator americanus]|uniref:G-protein coupled receptors family 1 profile domain-containing protein n=1 Tax=Necator americanus TaxID=51031 RepID=A0ABR1DCI7_NECAM